MSDVPAIGSFYESRNRYLEYQENKRWLNDYARHTGIDLSKNPYPIRSGYYRNYYNPFNEVFEASEAIMSLYGMKWFFK